MLNAGSRVLLAFVAGLSALSSVQAFLLTRVTTQQDALPVGSFAPMLEKVLPAVVTIRVTGETMTPVEVKPRQAGATADPLPVPVKETFRSGGSGVIVDAKNGYILTNNHVIENATSIDVGLADGRRLLAKLVGRDIGTDLAVIRVDARPLPSIAIGDSDAVRVGDVVVAVGNPFGLEGTATLGIVSAMMRTEIGHEAFEDYLQIDAQTNPGNSGGGLVNVKGELIGINTVIAGGRGQSYSVGFAIPVNMAKIIQTELITHGRMKRGSPGLIVQDLPFEPTMPGPAHGAIVTQVLPNSSAAAAEVKTGDVVVRVANKPVRSAAEYMTRVSTVPEGTALPLVVYADGKEKTVLVTVWSAEMKPVEKSLQLSMGSIAGAVVGDILLGNPLFGDLRGAQILELPAGAPAYEAGFEVGDVIVGVDGAKVRTSDGLLQQIAQVGLQYRVDIIRNGAPAWLRVSR